VNVLGVAEMERVLRDAHRIAVLGIKPESRSHLDAHQIPLYLQKVGYEVLPLPTRYPEASHILGVPVRRRLTELPQPLDVLNVFCKPADFALHLEDVLSVRPGVVWFQSGLLDPEAAARLSEAAIPIAEDCIGCRRASMSPSVLPFEAQRRRGRA